MCRGGSSDAVWPGAAASNCRSRSSSTRIARLERLEDGGATSCDFLVYDTAVVPALCAGAGCVSDLPH